MRSSKAVVLLVDDFSNSPAYPQQMWWSLGRPHQSNAQMDLIGRLEKYCSQLSTWKHMKDNLRQQQHLETNGASKEDST